MGGAVFFIGVIAVSLLFILGHDFVTQCRLFNAKRIVVDGNQRLSTGEVLRIAQVIPDMNIFALNLNVARKRLLANGWVAEATVRRELPDGIVVRITENVPMAVLDLGNPYIVDRKGVIFKAWETSDGDKLPRVTGLNYADIRTDACRPNEEMDDFLDLIKVLERGRTMSYRAVSRIHVDKDTGLTLFTSGPVKIVRFGFKPFEKKYQRLSMLMGYLKRENKIQAFKSVDLANENYIVASPVWEETNPEKTIRRS